MNDSPGKGKLAFADMSERGEKRFSITDASHNILSNKLLTNRQQKMKRNGCPFQSSPGYTTRDGRQQYLLQKGIPASDAGRISNSLQADLDPSKPLYFWQLYSLIGDEPIIQIVQDFYKGVYQDDEFHPAFSQISSSIDHHVQTQAMYWIDAMGGGKLYHGGTYRLNFHHSHNASQVMNAAGAKRWMHHMRNALDKTKFDDPRIQPCIVDFLKTKMQTYAQEHEWEFDESDFDFVKDLPGSSSLNSLPLEPSVSGEKNSDS